MKRSMLFVSALCALAALIAATAGASSPVTVSLAGCYFANGGQATVPAGSDVTVRFGLGWSNLGRGQDFLNAQTTTADINSTPIAGASSLWGPIQKNDTLWVTNWSAFAGTLANPGDSVTVHLQINLSRSVPTGKDPDTGQHFKLGPGSVLPADFGCTITAT
jgi:hypothetical protein